MVDTLHTVRADVHMHRLYAEYASLPVGVVTQCALNHTAMVQAAWLDLSGATRAERARQFWSHGEECLFDLLSRAGTREQRMRQYEQHGIWARMIAAGARVLDFGGGLGTAASLLSDAGKQVTYVDVDGAIARFAGWCFERGDQPVAMRLTSSDRPELVAGPFDLVLAENVLEYVADPVATVEALAAATGAGGLLCLRLDPRPEVPTEPHRCAIAIDSLRRQSPALRALQHLPSTADGTHWFAR